MLLAPVLVAFAALAGGCVPKEGETPEFMKLPKGYDPVGADLTFNKERFEAFNMMEEAARDEHVKTLKETPGSFKGQAVLKSGAGLGEAMEDSKYGSYELSASTEAVLFEIPLDYSVFTTEEIGKPMARHKAIEFTGTLVEIDFQDESKPRKLTLKVKADNVNVIKD